MKMAQNIEIKARAFISDACLYKIAYTKKKNNSICQDILTQAKVELIKSLNPK